MSSTRQEQPGNAPEGTLIVPGPENGRERILIQRFKLLIVSGPLQGREFLVEKDVFTIGSDPNSDLVLTDTTVSRRHCEIQLMATGYVIRDLDSTNGTVVQGVRVSQAFLDRGTEFQLGKSRIVFCPLQGAIEYTLSPHEAFGALLGESIPMRRLFHLAETYAPTNAHILIEGETGTGKEVLAEELHRHSKRANKPFVVVDCAALAKDVVPSELFGHVRGAFTGATSDRVGAFEHAEGGTVFLDEIGDLSPELQPNLLRVIEKKQVRRLGSNDLRPVNVRLIAATNRKLQHEVSAGNFREDLFFRLSVVRLEVPALRHRRDDIPLLTRKFLNDYYGDKAMEAVEDFDRTMTVFRQHDWPGNVRELRNVIEMASYSGKKPIDLSTFLYASRMGSPKEPAFPGFAADKPFKEAKGDLIRQFELQYLKELLARHQGNVSRAARDAGIERVYLQRLASKHGLK